MSFTPPPFGHPLSEGEPTGVVFRVASRFPLSEGEPTGVVFRVASRFPL